MLIDLHISNYALIQKLKVSWSEGLTAITGETGAGKSIILGALGLILGKRADSSVLYDPDQKCIVEGRFDISRYDLQSFFDAHDLDFEPETLIRREINKGGKSRAFINDTPVRINVLEALGGSLIHIHSQHETLQLGQSIFQIDVLDTLAGNKKDVAAYLALYKDWQTKSAILTQRKVAHEKAVSDRDYWQFQLDELELAQLDGENDNSLESELSGLQHAEETKRILVDALYRLNGDGDSAIKLLREVSGSLQQAVKWQADLAELIDRIESLSIEADDISAELEKKNDETVYDEERIEELNQRLDIINKLILKHRVQSVEELIALRTQLNNNISAQHQETGDLILLTKQVSELEESVCKKAETLHKKRSKAIPSFQKKVNGLLVEIGMPNSSLEVVINKLEKPSTKGFDQVQFLFASNKGSKAAPLGKVASGGELSRVMLCIKSLLAEKSELPTLIFDEIDTGVSGETG
ncbi:MAG: DNA repair protein RecN (Recombination protein N), partial [Limisphaerales bacterium]